jgi:predicted small lipoprotein YifL
MKKLFLAACLILLAGCGGKTPPPDWKVDSADLIERYKKHELRGENILAERYFQQAVNAAGSAGQVAETARLWLVRCAVRRASLDDDDCSEYVELAKLETTDEDRAYYQFITLDWNGVEASRLPKHYAALLAGPADKRLAQVAAVDAPLSRLLAASLVVQRGEADDALLALATETASAEGWKRPLLVYLKLAEKRASEREDAAALADIQARIRLIEQPFSASP